MNTFFSVFDQVMSLFLCIMIGYILARRQILPKNADVAVSRVLSWVCLPAMIIGSFGANCTPSNLKSNLTSLIYCVVMLAITFVLSLFIAPKFTHKASEINIYRYSIIITNFGFMGYSMINGLLGEEALFRYMIFALPASVFTYTVGVIWLTAGKEKFSWKMLVNPMFVSLLIGVIIGLFAVPLPTFVTRTIEGCRGCFSPLAMILTGIVIARFDFISLLKKKEVYALTLLRLVLLPLFFFALTLLLRVPKDIRLMIMFYSAMPLGLNTIVFPAAYGGDETPGASMAIISNVAALITVPLLLSLIL